MNTSLFCALLVGTWISLALFFKGFLLSKTEILSRGEPEPKGGDLVWPAPTCAATDVAFCQKQDSGHSTCPQAEECNQRRKFKRVFFFIVDALRLDFLTLHPLPLSANSPFSSSYNQFKQMHRLLRENSSQCALFGFRADPPTTTSQRLKGLMTGGLPAFVEFGANFNSAAVSEDSLIDQWRRSRKNLVMLGDDTWLNLFPQAFNTAFPFDSFNTRDLDTVDDGILQHLFPLLGANSSPVITDTALDNDGGREGVSNYSTVSSGDGDSTGFMDSEWGGIGWDVFISHFLGVDHIGHTHHAHHPAMGVRLSRMDAVLAAVIARLKEEDAQSSEDGDTLLLLFGDHGMTDAGEHGGNSLEETLSGLFVYSTGQLLPDPESASVNADAEKDFTLSWDASTGSLVSVPLEQHMQDPRVVEQVDLVPSLALLLGLPIPYTSLGQLIPELFSQLAPDREGAVLIAYRDNARQVMQYLFHYFLPEDDPPPPLELSADLAEVNATLLAAAVVACRGGENAAAPPKLMGDEACVLKAVRGAVQWGHGGNGPNVCARPASGISSLLVHHLSWRSSQVCADINQLYRGYLQARGVHALFDQLQLSTLSSGAALVEEELLLSIVQKQAHVLYADFLSSCLSFSRVQWSHFNVTLMVCGVTLCALCLLCGLRLLLASPAVSVSRVPLSSSSCGACLLMGFHWLSPFSNSFIVEEVFVYFFVTQVISLMRLWEIARVVMHQEHRGQRSGDQALFPILLDLMAYPREHERCQDYLCPETMSRNKHRRVSTLLFLVVVMEICALCIARWVLYVWQIKVDDAATGDTDGGAVDVTRQLWVDLVAPLLGFVLSFWSISLFLSSFAAGLRSAVSPGRSWLQWVVDERVASKLLFMAAAAMLLLHYAVSQTLLLSHAEGACLATSAYAQPDCGGILRILMLSLRGLLQSYQLRAGATDFLQTALPWMVLSCSGAGLCLEEALRRRRRRRRWCGRTEDDFSLHQQVLTAQCALHTYAHVSNALILVSVSVRNRCILLVTGQLWFAVCLLLSHALLGEARRECVTDDLLRVRAREEVWGAVLPSQSQHACQVAVQLSAMGRLLFFLSNHRYDFGTMQLSAGLIGADSFHFWRAGCLVALNTAGYSVLGAISLLPLTVGAKRLTVYATATYRVGLVLGSMGAALLLRRHLMLWAIFAPKVLFEAAFWLVDVGCLCLLYAT